MRRLLPVLLILSACATPEYRVERSACTAEWTTRIPPDYRQRLVQRFRTVEGPSGRTVCTTVKRRTTCVEDRVTYSVPYTDIETYDRNRPQRDAQISVCAARACSARYGNVDCKTGT